MYRGKNNKMGGLPCYKYIVSPKFRLGSILSPLHIQNFPQLFLFKKFKKETSKCLPLLITTIFNEGDSTKQSLNGGKFNIMSMKEKKNVIQRGNLIDRFCYMYQKELV